MELDGKSILDLANLLGSNAQVPASKPNENAPKAAHATTITPASLIPSSNASSESRSSKTDQPTRSKNIWEDDEYEEVDETTFDPREQPEYSLHYRQNISPSEVYMNASRSHSILDADQLVVSIHLPNTQMKDVDLACTPTTIDIRSPHYRLRLPLPETVDDQNGSAKWDKKKSTLIVSLPIVKDF
ncbi:PIH1 family [Gaertneriomyces semiglobifer]|nr:PIH1 family [Gaertneriomyces semiglobifer]